MIKLNSRKSIYDLLILYPLLNLVFCWLNKGDNMNTFSLSFCAVIFVCLLLNKQSMKVSVVKILFLFCTVGTVNVIVSFVREDMTSQVMTDISFAMCLLMMFIYSDFGLKIENFQQVLKQKKAFVHIVNICFISLLIAYVSFFGLRAGWNTWVLQGPYNYPHTLSYLLLFMIMQELYFLLDDKNKVSAIILMVLAIMLFLTAVRVALIALAFVVCYMMYYFLDTKQFRKFLFIGITISILLLIFYERGIFDGLIKKTELAISHGSVSNGRMEIALSSLRALSENNELKIMTGIGMSGLQKYNLYALGAAIHAHNDIVDVLVCYGIITLLTYLYAIYIFIKKNVFWIGISLAILILFNGLYVYVDCLPMLIYSRLLFEGVNKKKET